MDVYWYWPFVRNEELGVGHEFVKRGHSIHLHTIAGRLDRPEVESALEIVATVPGVKNRSEGTTRWLTSRAATYPLRARHRRQAIGTRAFDLAHIIYLNYFTDAFTLKTLSRRQPLVSTVHDVVPHQSRLPSSVQRVLLSRQYEGAGTIVVHHASVGRRLVAEFSVNPDRIHYVPWPVPELRKPVRAAGTGEGPATVLMFGTLRRNKGVHLLLEAMNHLRGEPIRLIIAGRGFADIERDVRLAAAQDTRIEAEIGFISEARKAELYEQSDVVVLPYTQFSSQSAVLHDAYCFQRPVVVTNVGALGESVDADKSGVVIAANNSVILAETLSKLLSDPCAQRTYAAAAAALADERSPQRVAQTLEMLYRTVLDSA